MTTAEKSTNYEFQAEVRQVLDLVIHSLYSNRDIFLRELISNASDAIDKLRFLALTSGELIKDTEELQIKISTDAEGKTLTVEDNGIGMNKEDLINNLGTIAKSGTKEFMTALKQSQGNSQAQLIGQFGVGFYSAFMVANSVRVITRKAGEAMTYLWESSGEGKYQIEELDQAELEKCHSQNLQHGCKIILTLKEDAEDYLQEYQLRGIIKKYSDFIEFPIKLRVQDEAWETVNSRKAIWTKSKNEIKAEEYSDFFKHLSHSFDEPLSHIHYSAEGTNEFTALLFIPKKAPFDLFMPEQKKGLQLYINRVFITQEAELLLPNYLRFIKGVVDAKDLPLNVSREVLQHNPKIAAIKKNLSKKILSTLEDIKRDKPDEYLAFYKEFSRVLKEGLHQDFANRDKILDLLMFESTKTKSGELTSLAQYLERMPLSQNENAKKEIYYITGESRKDLENSPYLEAFKARDIEVLFLVDPIDEWFSMSVHEYREKAFKAISQGDIKFDDEISKQASESHKDLLSKLKDLLKDKVEDVRFSDRLVDTLCCLVTADGGLSANLEKLYKAANQDIGPSKRTLELNPKHQVIEKLSQLLANNSEDAIKDYAELIYSQAVIMEGSKLEDPVNFSKLITKLMI